MCLDERINIINYIFIMEYYLSLKKGNNILWVKIDNIMLI